MPRMLDTGSERGGGISVCYWSKNHHNRAVALATCLNILHGTLSGEERLSDDRHQITHSDAGLGAVLRSPAGVPGVEGADTPQPTAHSWVHVELKAGQGWDGSGCRKA